MKNFRLVEHHCIKNGIVGDRSVLIMQKAFHQRHVKKLGFFLFCTERFCFILQKCNVALATAHLHQIWRRWSKCWPVRIFRWRWLFFFCRESWRNSRNIHFDAWLWCYWNYQSWNWTFSGYFPWTSAARSSEYFAQNSNTTVLQERHIAINYNNIPLSRWNNFQAVGENHAETYDLPYDTGILVTVQPKKNIQRKCNALWAIWICVRSIHTDYPNFRKNSAVDDRTACRAILLRLSSGKIFEANEIQVSVADQHGIWLLRELSKPPMFEKRVCSPQQLFYMRLSRRFGWKILRASISVECRMRWSYFCRFFLSK